MPLANRVICSLLFRPSGQGEYVCNSCSRQYRSAHGFTNLMKHLRRFHPGFKAETVLRNKYALQMHVVMHGCLTSTAG
ncbi:hypothetical protein PPTG_17814 [Phytophthora nicotianae INRA-310]|uniref:BED-type domain-containing protein n=4 Tax=Phytophthora nicotianae TaxID=4792 RepID=W2PIX8_PHYN3|nr:hypothetical protein PPTG_17814 [Phytophthora nicotianae INRA-310]ETN00596.1 hypothetical protein PPTG_17814 [Phytophthora nicotianae INRA-310]